MATQHQATFSDTSPLGLESILTSSLPATLLTDDAPERYIVEAVFSRRPEAEESAQITSDDTQDFFRQHGYPGTVLTIADRRLRIANTNLQELRDGLAVVVAERLATISIDIQTRRDAAAVRYRRAADQEEQRAAAVAVFASSVSFVTSGLERTHSPAPERETATGKEPSPAWDDDGGARWP